ncbi:complement C3-like isoform X2 [Mustelus asterias]
MEPLVILFLACLNLPLTEQKPSYLITAPDVLHVGMNETITVQAFDTLTSVDVTVYITRPTEESCDITLSQNYSVELNQMNNFTQVIFVQVIQEKTKHLNFTSSEQYVILVAEISMEVVRKARIRLSSRPYFIYITTDKPIYRPREPVRYQIFTLDQGMNPINSIVTVEVLDSQGTVLASEREPYKPSPVHSGEISLQENMTGRYQIRAKVNENSEYQGLISFQVQDYTFPKFDVRIIPDRSYYAVTDHSFAFTVQALNKSYGALHGNVTFGMCTTAGQRTPLPELSQYVHIQKGTAHVILSSEKLIKSIKENGGMDKFKTNTLYIAAEVLDKEGYSETKSLDGIPFLISPYNITLVTKPYFIPGAAFQFLISVTYHNGTPASGVLLQVSLSMTETPTFHATEVTDEIGERSFAIDVPWCTQDINIQVTAGDNSNGCQKINKTVEKYYSLSKIYLQINVPHTLLYPGDTITVKLEAINPWDLSNARYYNYMVLGRGKVLDYRRVEWAPVITFELPITRDMVPYFRIVAYFIIYDDGREEIIANSELIEVESLCDNKFQVDSAWKKHAGRNELSLTVLSETPAKVFVQAMDTRLKEMTTQDTISMRKVFEDLTSYDLGSTYGSGSSAVDVFHDSGLHLLSNLLTSLPQSAVHCQLIHPAVSGSSICLTPDIHPSSSKPIQPPYVSIEHGTGQRTVTIKQKELETIHDELINPTFNGSPMWSFVVRPGNEIFRLITDIDPSQAWEIDVLSLSRVDGLCLAEPQKLTSDDSSNDQ